MNLKQNSDVEILQKNTIHSNFDSLDVCMHDVVSSPRLQDRAGRPNNKIGYIKNQSLRLQSTYKHTEFLSLKPFL